jgi:hypothetical protein
MALAAALSAPIAGEHRGRIKKLLLFVVDFAGVPEKVFLPRLPCFRHLSASFPALKREKAADVNQHIYGLNRPVSPMRREAPPRNL